MQDIISKLNAGHSLQGLFSSAREIPFSFNGHNFKMVRRHEGGSLLSPLSSQKKYHMFYVHPEGLHSHVGTFDDYFSAQSAIRDMAERSSGAPVKQASMNPYRVYLQVKQASHVTLPVEIERPFENAQKGTGEAFWEGAKPGAKWGLGLGALAGGVAGGLGALRDGLGGPGRHHIPVGLALGGAAMFGLAGGAVGGLLGGAIGSSAKEEENWANHQEAVRKFEEAHGPLPYELSHVRQMAQMEHLKGQAVGMAADAAISGSPFGYAPRDREGRRGGVDTYGMGRHMGSAYGELSAHQQFNRALIDYKRRMA